MKEISKITVNNSPNYIAISPDGRIAATFDSGSFVIEIYETENLATPITVIDFDEIRGLDSPTVKISYSLAISNLIEKTNDALIVISCFNDKDMMKEMNYDYDDSTSNLQRQNDIDMAEKGDDFKTDIKPTTFVISKNLKTRIQTTIDECGGIVKFLDDVNIFNQSNDYDDNEFTNLIMMNASVIIKTLIYHNNNSYNSYSLKKSISGNLKDEYEFPSTIQAKIDNSHIPCTEFLQSSILSNYLFTEGYRNQRVEMYNLKTLDLEMIFQKRDKNPLSTLLPENPTFSISKFGHLLAHCSSVNSITIYLIENGLEIITKEFNNSNKILSISFVDNDEKLFIVTEETDGLTINIWDLFTFKSDIRKVVDNTNILNSLQGGNYHSLAISNGIILASSQDGNIFSVLESSDVKNILKPSSNRLNKLLSIDFKQEQQNNLKTNNSKDEIPYKYISFYLDENKTIQLIIGENVVQVWRGNIKKVLEYIWINPADSNKIEITSLEIGNCEFSLNLSLPSAISYNLNQNINIHWPNEAHILRDACVAIEYLRKHKPIRTKNQNKCDVLANDTEKLIKKYIKKNPDLWRLTETRYDIMANLIRSKHTLLLHQILFDYKKVYINDNTKTRVSRYLHIPRQYSWPVKKKESDLEIAIEKSLDREGKALVAMLLEYYSNNAEKNTGWMFTVTRAMPLLNQDHLESYLKELLYKPCFGAKEELVDSKFISQKKLEKGYDKDIYSLDIKPRLIKKQNERRWWSNVKNIRKTIKYRSSKIEDEEDKENTHVALRVVPLPDFTAYPENAVQKTNNWMIPLKLLRLFFWPRRYLIQKDDQRSPFLKFIRKNNEILYDSPAMEACINSKWIAARNHFLRHFLIFLLFGLTFSIIIGAIKVDSENLRDDGYIIPGTHIVFFYLGYYLLATEIVQVNYEGFKRYWSIYNLLDLGSVIVSVAVVINRVVLSIRILSAIDNSTYDVNDPNFLDKVLQDNGIDINQGAKIITILEAFAVLLLWLELMLLMRFFSRPATYINMVINILQAIWPFMVFMVGIILAFGHAMHILLQYPDEIELKPNGDNYETDSNSTIIPKMAVNQTFNVTDPQDNYYVSFPYSVMAVFFWILGRWDQLDIWDSWPVYVISTFGSILLVIIMQNLLIAIMTGVFEDATANTKLAVLKYRVELIADYEILEKIYPSSKENLRYIYYVGKSGYQEEWLDKAEKYRKHHKLLLSEDINNQLLTEKYDDNEEEEDDNFYGDSSKNVTSEVFESICKEYNDNDEKFLKFQNDVNGKLNEILSFIKKST